MTNPTRSSGGKGRNSYFAVSRSHRYSILFALPLLIGYEALAALLAQPGKGELRNGADAILRAAFTAVAGAHGSAIFMAVIVLLGVGLVVRDIRASGDRPRPRVFIGMLAESTALAVDSHGDVYVGEVSWTAWPQIYPDTPRPDHIRSLQKFEKVE